MITLEKIREGIDIKVILFDPDDCLKKAKVSCVGTLLKIDIKDSCYELDLVNSIIAIRRLYQDSRDVEVICDDSSFYLVSSTPAEREELYHCLMMIKHQEFEILNLHPLHKWVRIRKRNISEREMCCVCEGFISNQGAKFITCDICGIFIHYKHVSGFKKDCRLTTKESILPQEENSVETHETKIRQERQISDISDVVSYLSAKYHQVANEETQCLMSSDIASFGDVAPIYIIEPSKVKIVDNKFEIDVGDELWPVFVIINIRGGSNKGIEFIRAFKYIFNRIQVWEIPIYPLKKILRLLKNIKFHLIIGGGDGTIGWVMSEIQIAGIPSNNVKITVLPLGTGNDFSRAFGWGGEINSTTKITKYLKWMNYSVPVALDRWKIKIQPLKPHDHEATDKIMQSKKFKNQLLLQAEVLNILFSKVYIKQRKNDHLEYLDFIFQNMDNFIKNCDFLLESYIKDKQEFSNSDDYNRCVMCLKHDYVKFKECSLPKTRVKINKARSSEGTILESRKKEVRRPSFYSDSYASCITNIDNPGIQLTENDAVFEEQDFNTSPASAEERFLSLWRLIDKIAHYIMNKKYEEKSLVSSTGVEGNVHLFNDGNTLISSKYIMDPSYMMKHYRTNKCSVFHMNNYCGLGLDAKIAHDFQTMREACPKRFANRTMNKLYYGYLGTKEMIINSCRNLQDHILLECDGIPVDLPNAQALVILNIPSYMSGIDFWGSSHLKGFKPQSLNDGILEVCVVAGADEFGMARIIGCGKDSRVAQCKRVTISIINGEIPIQMDGEPYYFGPCVIEIKHDSTFFVLKRQKKIQKLGIGFLLKKSSDPEMCRGKQTVLSFNEQIVKVFEMIKQLIFQLKANHDDFKIIFKEELIFKTEEAVTKSTVDEYCRVYYKLITSFYGQRCHLPQPTYNKYLIEELKRLRELFEVCEFLLSNMYIIAEKCRESM
ncbi:Diacylglycerol kinase eta [Thelohanellus kitauei]|uniref:Diacylglycerol kinase n=1 Tax=Thelohanellus kitauei TaxID=669202 RepID=A0A0C2NE14_THEKT|nr:Diacylglycerol kinase eta [Thelohanellus kitauei]